MGFPYWGDGQPLLLPSKSTAGMDYWGDGQPIDIIYNPTQILSPASILSSEVFGTFEISTSDTSQEVVPTGISSAETFGAIVVIASQEVSPIGVLSVEVLGEHEIIPGPVTLSPAAIESTEAFGQTLVAPTQIIHDFWYWYMVDDLSAIIIDGIPAGLFLWIVSPTMAFYVARLPGVGTPVVMPGMTRIAVPIGITSPDDLNTGLNFGIPEVIPGPVDVISVGVECQEIFGTAKLVLGVEPVGVISGEATGTPGITMNIEPDSIASGEAAGNPALLTGGVNVSPAGAESQEVVGEPVLGRAIRAISIESVESFGAPVLSLFLLPASISGAAGVGSPGVDYLIQPGSVLGAAQVGTPQIVQIVRPEAIAPEEAAGELAVIPGPVWIYPSGIEPGAVCGHVVVRPPRGPANLIVLEVVTLPTLEFTDGLDEVDLYDSPLRMVVNG